MESPQDPQIAPPERKPQQRHPRTQPAITMIPPQIAELLRDLDTLASGEFPTIEEELPYEIAIEDLPPEADPLKALHELERPYRGDNHETDTARFASLLEALGANEADADTLAHDPEAQALFYNLLENSHSRDAAEEVLRKFKKGSST